MAAPPTTSNRFVSRVLAEQPWLAARVPEEDQPTVRGIAVRGFTVMRGGAQLDEIVDEPGMFGLLVLDGLLLRRVRVGSGACAEVIGPGELLRPWQAEDVAAGSITPTTGWRALRRTRVAVLDRRFAVATARWPEIAAALLSAAIDRAYSLGFLCATTSLSRLDQRLELVLWHLADRWGTMTPRGAHLPLPLSHEMLAEIVGVRRPSISAAISRARARGVLERSRDRTWLLVGEPPEALEARPAAAA